MIISNPSSNDTNELDDYLMSMDYQSLIVLSNQLHSVQKGLYHQIMGNQYPLSFARQSVDFALWLRHKNGEWIKMPDGEWKKEGF